MRRTLRIASRAVLIAARDEDRSGFPINADIRIPAVGFGTYLISPDAVAAAVSAAVANGYRHVDTASVYEELMRWGVQNGFAVLPKSMNPERMRQSLDLFGFSIDDEDMALIKTMDRSGGIAWSMGDPTLID
ncbi:hypothetical protein [Paraburkholderia lacunae]|uniref:hypothetical protein n=1 Tax=Paraburkholderia lacunae TaxID=2211104 RepID=UPI001AD8105D|nr:hypothetical protein [Paraburkholderia lacunae]